MNDPDQIQAYQLRVVRRAIMLEQQGLKHSGGSVRARWAARLGLKTRDSHSKFIEALDKLIEELS